MATIPTSIGPIGARQINRYFYVGQSDLTTIQKAVNAAIAMGAGTVIIPQEYAGTDTIAAVTNGIPSVYIMDERNGQRQIYVWYVNAYLQEGINPPSIGTAVFNHYIWVGPLGKYPTIQSAVNQAVQVGILYVVVVPFNYGGSDTIAAVTGGSTNVDILDLRYGQTQTYIWNGNQYVAATFQQRAGFVSMGLPPSTPPASASFYFDPTGTAGAGTAHINVTATPGSPMPAFEVIGIPSNSTPQQIFFRCNISGTGQFPIAGLPQIEMPCQLGLFNQDINNFNLWAGGGYIAGSKGMTIWAKAAEDAIDLQGQTIGGAYDQTIRLNYLGGNVEIGPITFDAAGNIIGIAAIEATSIGASTIAADDAAFATCEVDNSPVRTFANSPGNGGGSMVWPPVGIAVSLGDHWQDPSIAVASLATWPPAGIPVSTGTGWGSSIAPASIAFQPAAGVPVSIGTGWTTSIPIAVVPRTDIANTFAQPITIPQINGTSANLIINPAGTTYIAGSGTAGHLTVAPNGLFTTYSNSGSGLTVGTTGGLTITWNIGNGTGETDFINCRTNVGGGFRWYNQAPGDTVSTSTTPMMTLNSSGALSAISFTTAGTLSVTGVSTFANGNLRIGTTNTAGGTNIISDGTSIILNAASAAGAVFLIRDVGGAVIFGNGAGVETGRVNTSGSLNLAGNGFFGNVIQAQYTSANQQIQLGGSDNGQTCIRSDGTHTFIDAQAGNLQINVTRTTGPTPAMVVNGTIFANGTITSAAAKAFRIPHPLYDDKDLKHACLEGPEAGIYYRGEGATEDGRAEVTLPAYFEALAKTDERTVLLTQIYEEEDDGLTLLAATRVKDGKFRVRSSTATAKFQWEVKAVRGDIEALEVESSNRPPDFAVTLATPDDKPEDKPNERTQRTRARKA